MNKTKYLLEHVMKLHNAGKGRYMLETENLFNKLTSLRYKRSKSPTKPPT